MKPVSNHLLPEEVFVEGRNLIAKRRMLFIADGFKPEDMLPIPLSSSLVKHTAVKAVPYIREYEDEEAQSIDLLQQFRYIHNLGFITKPFVVLLNPFTRLLECSYYYYRPFIRLLNTRHVVALVVLNPADYIEPLLYALQEHRENHELPHIELTTSPHTAKHLLSNSILQVSRELQKRVGGSTRRGGYER